MDPASLVNARLWMTRYIMSIFLSFGVLGNLVNIYIFFRKKFLNNSCSLYLFAASIVNVITVSWGIIPSIYTLDNTDPSTYSFVYCKLRLYTIHTPLMIGRTLIVLACVDRFALCSGSLRLRTFCQAKVAIRAIIVTCLIWPILTLHIPIMQNFASKRCGMTGIYVVIYGFYSTFAAGVCPPTLMAIFSLLAIQSRRHLQTRLHTTRRENRRDHAMMIMLLSEVLVYVTTTSLYPAITLYSALTNQQVKSTGQLQIEGFIGFLGGSFLIYLNSASAFFVYLISSATYRKEVKNVFIDRIRRILGLQKNQVHPITSQSQNETIRHIRSVFQK